MRRPQPKATIRERYGPAESQFGELWLPRGKGTFPVVVLIHGGCWQSAYGFDLMNYLAADLREHGLAVWNIEYRRLGEAGGGYPGTYLDVAAAVDALRSLAKTYPFDLRRIVLVGHSAGGQLALWAAARPHLPATSMLRRENPLPVTAAVSLAGIDDVRAYRMTGPDACGGPATIDAITGAQTRPLDVALADTSPRALLPIGVPQVIVSGDDDDIVPPRFGKDYAAAAVASGDRARVIDNPAANHFDLIDPESAAWARVRMSILKFFN